MSTAEVDWTNAAASVTTAVTIPKFGGIMHSSEGTVFPWSGSDPDSETPSVSLTRKVTKLGTMLEPTMRRSLVAKVRSTLACTIPGFKYSTKIKENCTTFTSMTPYNGITPKDDTPTMTLSNYKQSTCRHMIINGLFDLFVIINTTAGGQNFDLFSSHSLFLEDDIKAHAATLRATGCLLIIENLMYSGTYLRNSIDATLYQKFIEDSGVNTTGPEVFGLLMKILYSDYFEAIDQCRATLKMINL
jgi:hypothetical protein